MARPRTIDPGILQAAIYGLEAKRSRIDDQIKAVRSLLGSGSASAKTNGRRRRKYRMSADGRARIIEATRRRWAASKKAGSKKKAR
jgi:hypothetical protein